MLNLNAVPDRFSGQDQLKQGPKTEGAEEESLHQAQEEVVVNAIDMEAGLQTPQLGLEGLGQGQIMARARPKKNG